MMIIITVLESNEVVSIISCIKRIETFYEE